MVKEELVEGIRQALARGESIEKAMMSFYNSGYPKEEIEQAAAAAQSQGYFSPGTITKQIQPGVVQRVSAYGNNQGKSSSKAITIVLITILVILLAGLAAIVIFKDKLASAFNGFF